MRINWLENKVLIGMRLKTSVGLEGIKSAPYYSARILADIIALDLARWNIYSYLNEKCAIY